MAGGVKVNGESQGNVTGSEFVRRKGKEHVEEEDMQHLAVVDAVSANETPERRPRDANPAKVLVVDLDKLKLEMGSQWIVVARYVTTSTFSSGRLFQRMREIWQLRGGVEYKDLAGSKFLIEFKQEGDYLHVLVGGPWTYLGDVLLVAAYDGESSVAEMKIDTMPVWVRIFDLPPPMTNDVMGRDIGELIAPVRMVFTDKRGKAWDEFLRVRIEHDINKPIEHVVRIQGKKDKYPKRYEVKYECLPRFCFYCGIVDHDYRACVMPEEEKVVRFSVEQVASPYKKYDRRSYYLPGEDLKTKKQLYYTLPARKLSLEMSNKDMRASGRNGAPRRDIPVPDHLMAAMIQAVDGVSKLSVGVDIGDKKETSSQGGAKPGVEPTDADVSGWAKVRIAIRKARKEAGPKSVAGGATAPVAVANKNTQLKKYKSRSAGRKASQTPKDAGQVLGKRSSAVYPVGKEASHESKKGKFEGKGQAAAPEGDGKSEKQLEATGPGATGKLTVLWQHEHISRNLRGEKQMLDFREVLSHCDLHDLGYVGADWTFDNKQDGYRNIQKKTATGRCPVARRYEAYWEREDQLSIEVGKAWEQQCAGGDLGAITAALNWTMRHLHVWSGATIGAIGKMIDKKRAQIDDNVQPGPLIDCITAKVDGHMNQDLCKEFTDKEISDALFQIGPLKAPGPDGFPARFFQRHWATVKKDIIRAVRNFFVTGAMPYGVNDTIIVLIPKIKNPMYLKDFCPISLCNVIYK
ncbi:hypothetical protein BRADI_4g02880v3, partial [Brachypodium distachyon]